MQDVKSTDQRPHGVRRRRHHSGREVRAPKLNKFQTDVLRKFAFFNFTANGSARSKIAKLPKGWEPDQKLFLNEFHDYLVKQGVQVHGSRLDREPQLDEGAAEAAKCTSPRSALRTRRKWRLSRIRWWQKAVDAMPEAKDSLLEKVREADRAAVNREVAEPDLATLAERCTNHGDCLPSDHGPGRGRTVQPSDRPQGSRPRRLCRGSPQRHARRELADRKGIIISGRPGSVYEPGSPNIDPRMFLRPACRARHLLRPPTHGAPSGRHGAQGRQGRVRFRHADCCRVRTHLCAGVAAIRRSG